MQYSSLYKINFLKLMHDYSYIIRSYFDQEMKLVSQAIIHSMIHS